MICSNCQTNNPEQARFCLNCGNALAPAAHCPNCGSPILPGASFCHHCGQALGASLPAMLPERLQKYIPRELWARLQAAPADRSPEGERRVVTMLFCDVKGSTALAERLDPEDWAEIMNGAFQYLIPPVVRYEGTIPSLMGDAILAFFGAPVAHEDDPERAVRAGLEIVAGIREYRAQIQRERGLDFDVRVGINTGLVVVGEVGSDLRQEYSAMGDAINLAARMEQTARPGTVQISAHTYQWVAGLFDVEPLGEIDVKGKSQPVQTYRVLGLKSSPERLPGISGIESPLVGREAEMGVLRHKLAAVRQGQGGIIVLIGEAGLGKSRLIAELQQAWEQSGSPGSWELLSLASYAAAQPYGQVREQIRKHIGIAELDPPDLVRQKIEQIYAATAPALSAKAVSLYSLLMGLATPADETLQLALEVETFKMELFDLVLSFERARAGSRPFIQVFDDLHWVDPASAELMIHLLQLMREKPVLFVFAFRPDPGTPAWLIEQAAQSHYPNSFSEIRLDPLSPADTQVLIRHFLSGADQNRGLREQILERAEGNPLFVEEVIRELLERGALEGGPQGLIWKANQGLQPRAIPDSLHALLTARLDRLKEDTRRTLQLAAIIGRSFYYTVLQQIVETPIELDQELESLQGSELIQEVRRQPEREFQFRHALVQEAAYHSILVRRRREYHRRVAAALEVLFADRLEDHAGLLAHHYAAAGDSRARRYFRLAGRQAGRVYARQEALANYTRALEIPGAGSEELISTHEERGEILFSLGRFEPASADFEAALELARRAGRSTDESRILGHLAWLRWSSGNSTEALELAQEAEARAESSGDLSQILHAAIILGTALQNLGQIAAARSRLRQALFASRRQNRPSLTALSLYYLAMLENFAGQFRRSAVCAQQAYDLYTRLGDLPKASGVLFSLSLAEGGRGCYDRAIAALDQGRLIAEKTSPGWMARYPNQRAWLSAELGDWETAYEVDLSGLQSAKEVPGFREIEISTMINLVLDCTALEKLAEARDYLSEAHKDLGRPEFGSHNWRWSVRLADAGARLELAQGDLEGAEQSIASLLGDAQQVEARKYTARGLLLRGQLRRLQGAFATAEADLQAVSRLADSLCYWPTRIEARLELARLYTQNGRAGLAKQSFAEASSLVDTLGAQIEHPELHASFERGIRLKLKNDH